MRSIRAATIVQDEPADAVFQAALGVAQNNKKMTVVAVHTAGRKLVVREKGATNAKLYVVIVEQTDSRSDLMVEVGNDPRTLEALLDGMFNKRALGKYIAAVRSVLDGATSAPVTPVADHFLQGKTEVPWDNPDVEPDIELGENFAAIFFGR